MRGRRQRKRKSHQDYDKKGCAGERLQQGGGGSTPAVFQTKKRVNAPHVPAKHKSTPKQEGKLRRAAASRTAATEDSTHTSKIKGHAKRENETQQRKSNKGGGRADVLSLLDVHPAPPAHHHPSTQSRVSPGQNTNAQRGGHFPALGSTQRQHTFLCGRWSIFLFSRHLHACVSVACAVNDPLKWDSSCVCNLPCPCNSELLLPYAYTHAYTRGCIVVVRSERPHQHEKQHTHDPSVLWLLGRRGREGKRSAGCGRATRATVSCLVIFSLPLLSARYLVASSLVAWLSMFSYDLS